MEEIVLLFSFPGQTVLQMITSDYDTSNIIYVYVPGYLATVKSIRCV